MNHKLTPVTQIWNVYHLPGSFWKSIAKRRQLINAILADKKDDYQPYLLKKSPIYTQIGLYPGDIISLYPQDSEAPLSIGNKAMDVRKLSEIRYEICGIFVHSSTAPWEKQEVKLLSRRTDFLRGDLDGISFSETDSFGITSSALEHFSFDNWKEDLAKVGEYKITRNLGNTVMDTRRKIISKVMWTIGWKRT